MILHSSAAPPAARPRTLGTDFHVLFEHRKWMSNAGDTNAYRAGEPAWALGPPSLARPLRCAMSESTSSLAPRGIQCLEFRIVLIFCHVPMFLLAAHPGSLGWGAGRPATGGADERGPGCRARAAGGGDYRDSQQVDHQGGPCRGNLRILRCLSGRARCCTASQKRQGGKNYHGTGRAC
jgi:hypothetical protein